MDHPLDLETCQTIVNEIVPDTAIDDPIYSAMLVLVSALRVGPNINRIAKFTGIDKKIIRPIARRLRENGVWRHDVMRYSWVEDGDSVAIIMDAQVATGKLTRAVTEDEDGEFRYSITKKGFDEAQTLIRGKPH